LNVLTDESRQKSAVVAIIGRPSVGKSTFLNAASGHKVSIVSRVPQTTRNALRGIVNTEQGQLVFIDTPGYHQSEKKMNRLMQRTARSSLQEADAILYVLDSGRHPGEEEDAIARLLAPHQGKTVAAVNKIDLEECFRGELLLYLGSRLPEIPQSRVLFMSALPGSERGIPEVLDALYALAPQGEPLYPPEYYTDQRPEFRAAEIIREKAINRLYDEVPHAVFVEIADMETRGEGLSLRAFLCVETESQKGIVIGKGASVIKAIRIESVKELRNIFACPVALDLRVKVRKNWKHNDSLLENLLN
jgi:GTP-binding protein Era